MAQKNLVRRIWIASLVGGSSWLAFHASIPPAAPPEIQELSDTPLLFADTKTSPAASDPIFADETFIRGILHRHLQKKTTLAGLDDTLGAGVCVLDFDNDGWDDLFFVSGSGNRRHFGKDNWWQSQQTHYLYHNRQGAFFEDVSAQAGLLSQGTSFACAAADLDQDGYVDLVLGNRGANQLFRNTGRGRFEIVEAAFPIDDATFTTSILVRDFNADGKPDVLFGNYVDYEQEKNVFEKNSGFAMLSHASFDATLFEALPDRLYLNQDDLKFTLDQTLLKDANGHGRTLSFLTLPGDSDILALNDRGSPSQVVASGRAQGASLIPTTINARDAVFLDADLSEPGTRVLVATNAQRGGLLALAGTNRFENDRSWDLALNQESRLYANGWAILHGDFNNDARKDLFVANGSSMPHPDTYHTTIGQPNSLLVASQEHGQSTYRQVTQPFERTLSARGAAMLDVNNDGLLDIAVANNNDFASLLVNLTPTTAPWVGLKCVPVHLCERVAISTRSQWFRDPFVAQRHYLSQSATGLILPHTDHPDEILAVHVDGEKAFEFSVAEHSGYWLIDVAARHASPLLASTAQLPSSSEAWDELTLAEYLGAMIRSAQPMQHAVPLLTRLRNAADENKLRILLAIQNQVARDYFALVEYWARTGSKPVVLAALKTLEQLEVEASVPTLLNLVESADTDISCAASRAFEHFFREEEAVLERKYWAVNVLVEQLDTSESPALPCMIDALAESESLRAVQPLTQVLSSGGDYVASRAARALGMTRQQTAVAPLLSHLETKPSPLVTAQVLLALTRLAAEIPNDRLDELFARSPLYASLVITGLTLADDGVALKPAARSLIEQYATGGTDFLALMPAQDFVDFSRSLLPSTPRAGDSPATLVSPTTGRSASLSLAQFLFLAPLVKEQTTLVQAYAQLAPSDRLAALEPFGERLMPALAHSNPRLLEDACSLQGTSSALADSSSALADSSSALADSSSALADYCNALAETDRGSLGAIEQSVISLIQTKRWNLLDCLVHSRLNSRIFRTAVGKVIANGGIETEARLKLALGHPLHASQLHRLESLFHSSSTEQQLALLEKLEGSLDKPALHAWLRRLDLSPAPRATQLRINAMLGESPRDLSSIQG